MVILFLKGIVLMSLLLSSHMLKCITSEVVNGLEISCVENKPRLGISRQRMESDRCEAIASSFNSFLVPLVIFCIRCIMVAIRSRNARDLTNQEPQMSGVHHHMSKSTRLSVT